VGYVFTIHIPIALACLLAPILKINPACLMLMPLHIVLLELIVDPTCSVVLERQPAERGIMDRRPRDPSKKLINVRTLLKSFLQGLAVFAASFGPYLFLDPNSGQDAAAVARSMGLAVIMLANLFLVQVNSSDIDSVLFSVKRLARDKIMWAVNVITLAGLLVILYTPLNGFLKLAPLSSARLLAAFGLAAASVLWYEIVKAVKRIKMRQKENER